MKNLNYLIGTGMIIAAPIAFAQSKDNNFINEKAVFIVDIQPRYIEHVLQDELKSDIKSIAELLIHAKKEKMPVYVFEIENNEIYKENPDPGFRSENNGTIDTLAKIINSMPKEQVHRYKNKQDPNIKKDLNEHKVKKIIGAGIYSIACLKQALYNSKKDGFKVYTSPDISLNAHTTSEEFAKEVFKNFGIEYLKNSKEFYNNKINDNKINNQIKNMKKYMRK